MERKEPTINTEAVIDEPASSAREAGPASTDFDQRSYPVAKRESNKTGIFALIVAIAALGGSGFLAWQLQQSQLTQQAAEARIVTLEKQLDSSEEESLQSVEAIRAKLKWADSEIRKLWGIAYDRNRKNISANSDTLKSVESTLASVGKTAKQADKDASKAVADIAAVNKKLAAMEKTLTSLASSDTQKQLRDLIDKSNQLQAALTSLETELVGRVRNNEDSIEAIDAYRISIRRELQEMHQKLNRTGP